MGEHTMAQTKQSESRVWIILYITLGCIFTIYTLNLYNQSLLYPEKWKDLSKVWLVWTCAAFFILMWISCFFNQLGSFGNLIKSYSIGLGYWYADFSVIIGLPMAILWSMQLIWTIFRSTTPFLYLPLLILGLLIIYTFIKKESLIIKVIVVNLSFPLFLVANLINFGLLKL